MDPECCQQNKKAIDDVLACCSVMCVRSGESESGDGRMGGKRLMAVRSVGARGECRTCSWRQKFMEESVSTTDICFPDVFTYVR